MDLNWLGHSCFRLHADDMVVITDPFPRSLGLTPDPRPATVVTVSNPQPNHSNWQEVDGDPKVFNAPGEYEYSGISVRGVMTPLSEGTPRESRNVAYSVEIDNVNICHLGDLTEPLTTRQIQDLMPVDVLLLPTGGHCTLDVDRLAQLMQDLDPKIVIPMHYSTPGVSVPLDGVEIFLRHMGVSDVQPQPRLSVTASNLSPNLRVVLMSPMSRASS
jgi:L-ascorbate metabolism protein UlaG (beta-lactamase superfamily)